MVLVAFIIALVCHVVYLISMFTGEIYEQDEKELQEHPHSYTSQRITAQREAGTYEVYIPPEQREDYKQRYGYVPYERNKSERKGRR